MNIRIFKWIFTGVILLTGFILPLEAQSGKGSASGKEQPKQNEEDSVLSIFRKKDSDKNTQAAKDQSLKTAHQDARAEVRATKKERKAAEAREEAARARAEAIKAQRKAEQAEVNLERKERKAQQARAKTGEKGSD